MKDIPGQTALYSVTPQEQLKNISDAREQLIKLEIALHENHAVRKLLMDDIAKAQHELDAAIGGESLQLRIESIKKEVETSGLAITTRETTKSVLEARQRRVEEGAIRVIKASGGLISNKALAQLLNQDEHGLNGLLAKSTQIVKDAGGRIGNDVVYWKLAEGVK